MTRHYLTCLSIAGSDPSCGAGIQADLKTFSALGIYGLTVPTALTVQSTLGVTQVMQLPGDFVRAQLEAVFEDIRPRFIKIGMTVNCDIIRTIAEVIEKYAPTFVVLDPIMTASSGHALFSPDALDALKRLLIPRCTLVTPNLPELQALTHHPLGECASEEDILQAGRALLQMGCGHVLVKGGHRQGDAVDFLITKDAVVPYSAPRIASRNTHGTGCTLSSAITAYRAMEQALPWAIAHAKEYLSQAMEAGREITLGAGRGPLNHFFAPRCPIIKQKDLLLSHKKSFSNYNIKTMKAFVFPGQGAQFVGMGKDLYETNALAKSLFEKANEILGYRITDIMFEGTDEDLKQTKVTQPAVFLHSVISALCMGDDFCPDMVGGHSLGEFSALVAAQALSFEDGLKLVYARAMAMQKACELKPSTMAAIIALPDETVEEVCASINTPDNVVVPANYNCPGQLVISGDIEAVEAACNKLKEAGAKRAMLLKVGGAFHSPLMQPAKDELEKAILETEFHTPKCPVYQNVDAKAHTDASEIKANLIAQLTSPVRWTAEVQTMVADGATDFTECGPGKVLQGMIVKICKGNDAVKAHGIGEN